ncbi:MAG: hypothetical protein WBP37_13010, partial [Candidatus Dechloromonas phosphoritropha]
MKTLICIVMLTALGIGIPASAQTAKPEHFSPSELNSRMLDRRAVEAVIWGLPLVGQHAVRQAAFRDGKANYNDIVWWPKGSWKNQSPTPNVNTRYIYWFI